MYTVCLLADSPPCPAESDSLSLTTTLRAGSTDYPFASSCSPPHFAMTQLLSATTLWLTPTGTFTLLLSCPLGARVNFFADKAQNGLSRVPGRRQFNVDQYRVVECGIAYTRRSPVVRIIRYDIIVELSLSVKP